MIYDLDDIFYLRSSSPSSGQVVVDRRQCKAWLLDAGRHEFSLRTEIDN